jgi:hypothetical protein
MIALQYLYSVHLAYITYFAIYKMARRILDGSCDGRFKRNWSWSHSEVTKILFIKLYVSHLSVSSTGDTPGRQRKRDNLLTGEGEVVVEERNNNSILSETLSRAN